MFTGLVAGCGIVHAIEQQGDSVRLEIALPTVDKHDGSFAEPCEIGESIAINGCCLTVITIDEPTSAGPARIAFQAGEETLTKTNLGRFRPGDPVNLERALPVSARLGGHFVQGHVDGVGTIDTIRSHGEWIDIWFRVPSELADQMVAKGSITVDGVSLTVVHVEAERFSVALIPHTLQVTTFGTRHTGDAVNIETDILGKYVQKFLGGVLHSGAGPGSDSGLTMVAETVAQRGIHSIRSEPS